jgi:hypothetical protein
MREELDKKLTEKYPRIFKNRYGDMKETCMCWGLECGNGWYKLIDCLCALIENHVKNLEHNEERKKEINEIKTALRAGDDTKFEEYYKTFGDAFKVEAKARLLTEDLEEVKEVYPVVASQVKEKFGGLRFYIEGGDDTVFAYIDFAEHLSYYICEECGSMDHIGTTSGWIITLCKSCAEKENRTNWKEHEEK